MEQLVERLFIFALLGVGTYMDLKNRELSGRYLIGFGGLGGLLLLKEYYLNGFYLPFGMLVGVFLLLISRFTKEAIGEGDAVILMITGLFLRFEENLVLMIIGSSLAAAFGLILILKRKADKRKELPFLPFLAVSYTGMVIL